MHKSLERNLLATKEILNIHGVTSQERVASQQVHV
jgi:hypothetical protein